LNPKKKRGEGGRAVCYISLAKWGGKKHRLTTGKKRKKRAWPERKKKKKDCDPILQSHKEQRTRKSAVKLRGLDERKRKTVGAKKKKKRRKKKHALSFQVEGGEEKKRKKEKISRHRTPSERRWSESRLSKKRKGKGEDRCRSDRGGSREGKKESRSSAFEEKKLKTRKKRKEPALLTLPTLVITKEKRHPLSISGIPSKERKITRKGEGKER